MLLGMVSDECRVCVCRRYIHVQSIPYSTPLPLLEFTHCDYPVLAFALVYTHWDCAWVWQILNSLQGDQKETGQESVWDYMSACIEGHLFCLYWILFVLPVLKGVCSCLSLVVYDAKAQEKNSRMPPLVCIITGELCRNTAPSSLFAFILMDKNSTIISTFSGASNRGWKVKVACSVLLFEWWV